MIALATMTHAEGHRYVADETEWCGRPVSIFHHQLVYRTTGTPDHIHRIVASDIGALMLGRGLALAVEAGMRALAG